MLEQQNIEYKQSWHDDYLKWVCGFANAQGGAIFIGKDDNGSVVGIDDYKKLMDDIPNKPQCHWNNDKNGFQPKEIVDTPLKGQHKISTASCMPNTV